MRPSSELEQVTSSMASMISKFWLAARKACRGRLIPGNAKTYITAAALLFVFFALGPHSAAFADEQVCDVAADVALGLEDFPTAIALHKRLLQSDKTDALAHYHLGYAYGMVGRIQKKSRNTFRPSLSVLASGTFF